MYGIIMPKVPFHALLSIPSRNECRFVFPRFAVVVEAVVVEARPFSRAFKKASSK
jgi:hypothetical protein